MLKNKLLKHGLVTVDAIQNIRERKGSFVGGKFGGAGFASFILQKRKELRELGNEARQRKEKLSRLRAEREMRGKSEQEKAEMKLKQAELERERERQREAQLREIARSVSARKINVSAALATSTVKAPTAEPVAVAAKAAVGPSALDHLRKTGDKALTLEEEERRRVQSTMGSTGGAPASGALQRTSSRTGALARTTTAHLKSADTAKLAAVTSLGLPLPLLGLPSLAYARSLSAQKSGAGGKETVMLDDDETDVKSSKGTGKDVESELGVGEKELKWLAGQAATRSPLWLFLRLFPGSSAQLLDKSNLASDSALLQKYSKLDWDDAKGQSWNVEHFKYRLTNALLALPANDFFARFMHVLLAIVNMSQDAFAPSILSSPAPAPAAAPAGSDKNKPVVDPFKNAMDIEYQRQLLHAVGAFVTHIAKTHGDKLFAVFSLYGPMPAKLDLLVQRLRLPNERLPAHVAHNELLKQGIKDMLIDSGLRRDPELARVFPLSLFATSVCFDVITASSSGSGGDGSGAPMSGDLDEKERSLSLSHSISISLATTPFDTSVRGRAVTAFSYMGRFAASFLEPLRSIAFGKPHGAIQSTRTTRRFATQALMHHWTKTGQVAKNLNIVNEEGDTLIIHAALENYTEVLAACLPLLPMESIDVVNTQTDKSGKTALMIAAADNRPETISVLMLNGADSTVRDPSGSTAVMYAVLYNATQAIRAFAAYNKRARVENWALVDLTEVTADGKTLLMLCAIYGREKAARALAEYGDIDVNAAEPMQGRTALEIACERGAHNVVNVLVTQNANIYHTDKNGMNALMIASEAGHVTSVESLLVQMLRNYVASRLPGEEQRIRLYNLDDKARGRDNMTALMMAAAAGHYMIVDRLLKAGANPLVQNRMVKKGKTAFDFAAEKGHERIADLLKAAMEPLQQDLARIDAGDRTNISFERYEALFSDPIKAVAHDIATQYVTELEQQRQNEKHRVHAHDHNLLTDDDDHQLADEMAAVRNEICGDLNKVFAFSPHLQTSWAR